MYMGILIWNSNVINFLKSDVKVEMNFDILNYIKNFEV